MLLELLQLNTCSQKEMFKVIKTIWAFAKHALSWTKDESEDGDA